MNTLITFQEESYVNRTLIGKLIFEVHLRGSKTVQMCNVTATARERTFEPIEGHTKLPEALDLEGVHQAASDMMLVLYTTKIAGVRPFVWVQG